LIRVAPGSEPNSNSDKVVGGEPGWRDVWVLLDAAAFSEETLRKLYKLVSTRFPRPYWLQLWVTTSLDQLKTPEQLDQPVHSLMPDNPAWDRHHWAFIERSRSKEIIRYNPSPPKPEMKTITLRAKEKNRK